MDTIFSNLFSSFDKLFAPATAVTSESEVISDDPLDQEGSAHWYQPIIEEGEQLVFSQLEWSVSDDGSFETKYQVYQLTNGYYVPAVMISQMGGDPTFLVGEQMRLLSDATQIASGMACEEHCSSPA